MSLTEPAVSPGLDLPAAIGAVRIIDVEAIPFARALSPPGALRVGQVERADNVLVRIHTDAGARRHAEAQPRPYTYGETQASIVAAIRECSRPASLGLDPSRSSRRTPRCAGIAGNQAPAPQSTSPRGTCGRPARRRAVLDAAGRLRVGVAVAHMVSFDEPAAMADEAPPCTRSTA